MRRCLCGIRRRPRNRDERARNSKSPQTWFLPALRRSTATYRLPRPRKRRDGILPERMDHAPWQADSLLRISLVRAVGTMKYFIYGLFDETGKCRYVGMTGRLRDRKYLHQLKRPTLQFRVLLICDWIHRMFFEKRIIAHFRTLGLCDLNGNPANGKRGGQKAWITRQRNASLRKLQF